MALLIFIAILVALIWVHELGHFSVAKLFGIRVDEFAIGFPPKLFRVRYGETDYTFNLLLVGGFVKIHGENPDDGPADPRSLVSKNRGIQALVMLAGIAFNLLFAWLALSAGYMVGLQTAVDHKGIGYVTAPQVLVTAVQPNSPADKVGLKPGDIIEKVQTGTATLDTATLNTDHQAETVQNFIGDHQEESLVLTVARGQEQKTYLAKPEAGLVPDRKIIGVQMDSVGLLKLSPPMALVQGAIIAKELTVATAQGLSAFFSQLFVGKADFSQVSGPIGIAGQGSQAVKDGFGTALTLAALISINLALINLIPIPGLDGGRLLIIAIEAIIRRPVNPRITNGLMLAGFAFIVILMLLVSYHDVIRLVG